MITYKCDLCKKECKHEEITTVQAPMNKYVHAITKSGVKVARFKSSIELSNIDICPTCIIKIADFLESYEITME